MALPFYKYDNNPTVYRGSDNHAFSTWDEFTKAGGASNLIETRPQLSVGPVAPQAQPQLGSIPMPATASPAPTPSPVQVPSSPTPVAAPKPAAAPLPPVDNTPVRQAEAAYQQALQLSPEEIQAQTDLNNLTSSFRQGVTDIQGKPIALDFQTGQLENLQRRATDMAIPLEQKLALAQARRQASTDASKFALTRADEQYKTAVIQQQQQQQTSQEQQQNAKDFALQYNVQKPYYEVGGTVYRTADNKAYSTPEQFFADGGAKDFSNVQKVANTPKPVELSPGNQLVDPVTGRVIASAPKVTGGGGTGGVGIGQIGSPTENPQLYAGLASATATAVRQQVTAFKSEPTVQNFAVIQEGRNFAKSLSDTTTNPADDQALIYALAKALDPGSVVREGEYATAQKYAQSWITAFGKGVEQAINGTGFLSQQARANIKKTIEQKYNSSKGSYDNLFAQYSSNIGRLTGRGDGQAFLNNYSSPANSSTPQVPTGFIGPIAPGSSFSGSTSSGLKYQIIP